MCTRPQWRTSSANGNRAKVWNHKVSVLGRTSKGVWSNFPCLIGLSPNPVCSWIPQAPGNSLPPRAAASVARYFYFSFLSEPEAVFPSCPHPTEVEANPSTSPAPSCWLFPLQPGIWAHFLFCTTVLRKWKSASVESQNCRAGRELLTTFGPVTEEETEARRGKESCLKSLLVEKSVSGLLVQELLWRVLRDARSSYAGCTLPNPRVTLTF